MKFLLRAAALLKRVLRLHHICFDRPEVQKEADWDGLEKSGVSLPREAPVWIESQGFRTLAGYRRLEPGGLVTVRWLVDIDILTGVLWCEPFPPEKGSISPITRDDHTALDPAIGQSSKT